VITLDLKRCGIPLFVLLFVPIRTLAQLEVGPVERDTLQTGDPGVNRVVMGFDKTLATYQWFGSGRLDRSIGPASVRLREHFRSTVIRTNRTLIRDEQFLDLRLQHRWSERMSGIVEGTNFALSDDRRFVETDRASVSSASSNNLYGGFQARIFDDVFVEPLVGYRFDNQGSEKDRGTSFMIGAWSPNLDVGGYNASWSGRIHRDYLSPRTLQRDSVFVGVGKTFFDRTRDTLHANYFSSRREFYFPADSTTAFEFQARSNIEQRSENVLSVSNTLEYNIGSSVMFSLQGTMLSRSIDRRFRYRPLLDPASQTLVNTTVDEFRLGGSAQLLYTPNADLEISLLLLLSERDERHDVEPDDRIAGVVRNRSVDEARKNNLSRRTSIASGVTAALSHTDSIRVVGAASLLRYDTPSDQNHDDRDELWYSFNVTTSHRLSHGLHLRLVGDVNMTHLVYIRGERSANNTWNRIARFAPRVLLEPTKRFSSTNTFEVLANYTVYDFENDPATQAKSFSFRQVAFVDSTRLAMTSRLALVGFAHVRLYQRGELRWRAFKERPVNDFEDKTFLGWIEYALNAGTTLSIGARYFSQLRYQYVDGRKEFEGLTRNIGPLASFRSQVSDHSSVAIQGWYERQTQRNAPSRGFANMTMSLMVNL
jgi:hypothetical protein